MKKHVAIVSAVVLVFLSGFATAAPSGTNATRQATASICSTATASAAAANNSASDPIVSFNTQTHKYHCPTCRYAKQCTKNCIEIKTSEAIAKGGVACKICGGVCK